MELERFNGTGTSTMETPYGKATLEVSREATTVNSTVRTSEGSIVVRTRYDRPTLGGEWKPETNGGGHRKPATWGYSVPKKERHNMQIVVDALVLAWLKDHKAELVSQKVASLRARAWRMASSANDYARYARELIEQADTVEQEVA